MKKDNQIEDKINNYISGSMTQDEKLGFERLLSEDEALRLRVENEALIKLNIRRYHKKQIKEQLKLIHKKTLVRKSKLKYLVLNGIIALLSILAFFYMTKKETISNQAIYAQHYDKYEINSDQRSSGDQSLDDVFEYYMNNDYNRVVTYADELLMNNLTSSKKLIIGISNLEIDNLKRAKSMFQSIIDEKDIVFKDQALWYLALTELKLNNLEAANVILDRMVNDKSSDRHNDALELRKVLLKNN